MVCFRHYLPILIFILLTPLALAQTDDVKGKIRPLTYSPSEPIVSQGVTISAGVENPDSIDHQYNLVILIAKAGRIKYEEKFDFALKSGRSVTFSPIYTPDDIGEFQIVAKLYDKFQAKVLSSEFLTFNAGSHIGPFDLEVSVISDVVKPNTKIPVVVQLLNMGDSGTDVEVRLKLPCQTVADSVEKFIVFLKPKQSLKKVTQMLTCPEEGLHELTGEITLFNRTWISSSSQVFLNSSSIELSFDLPEKFEFRRGESKIFDLSVTNSGNKVLYGLQIVMTTIPQDWIKVVPNTITELKPQEKAVFIINFTIPNDAEPTTYDFGISVAAAETLLRKQTSLQITDLPGKSGFNLPLLPTPNISGVFSNLSYLILIGSGFIVSVIIVRMVTKSRSSHQRIGLLAKIRGNLSPVKSGEFKVITLKQFKQELARKRR